MEALPRLDVRIGSPEKSLLQYARWRLLDAVRRSLTHEPTTELDECMPSQVRVSDVLDSVNVAVFLIRLTPIQRRIATCLLDGFTWRETGEQLGCTSANIAYHVRRIGVHYQAFSGIH